MDVGNQYHFSYHSNRIRLKSYRDGCRLPSIGDLAEIELGLKSYRDGCRRGEKMENRLKFEKFKIIQRWM